MAVGAEGCEQYLWVERASVACSALISIAAGESLVVASQTVVLLSGK